MKAIEFIVHHLLGCCLALLWVLVPVGLWVFFNEPKGFVPGVGNLLPCLITPIATFIVWPLLQVTSSENNSKSKQDG